MPVVILRSLLGRLGAALVALVCLYASGAVWLSDGYGNGLRALAVGAAVTVTTWLLWWRPLAVLSQEGVRVRNAWRTHRLAWPDLSVAQTRWGLVLQGGSGRVGVSACQRGGLLSAVRHERRAPRAREEYLVPVPPGRPPRVYRTHLDADDAAYLIGLYAAARAEDGLHLRHEDPQQADPHPGGGPDGTSPGSQPASQDRWDPAPIVAAALSAAAVIAAFTIL